MIVNGSLPLWFSDSEAITHIMTSLNNIQSPRPFTGKDSILTTDGTSLIIKNTGQSIVKDILNNSFVLRDLLHTFGNAHFTFCQQVLF